MEHIDLLLDACFLLSGVAGIAAVIILRKRFDTWLGLLTCFTWALKGARMLGYDWMITALRTVKEPDVFILMQKASNCFQGMDILICLLLAAALVRLTLLGAYWHWYAKSKKAMK